MLTARQTHLLGNWTSARSVAERMRSAMFLSKIGETPYFAYLPTGSSDEPGTDTDWAGAAAGDGWFRLLRAGRATAGATPDEVLCVLAGREPLSGLTAAHPRRLPTNPAEPVTAG